MKRYDAWEVYRKKDGRWIVVELRTGAILAHCKTEAEARGLLFGYQEGVNQ